MIHILLAHPSRLVCDSIRNALDQVEDVYVVGCATSTEEVHFLLPHGDVVLLGADLDDGPALDLLEDIRTTHPQKKVLVLGIDNCPEMILRYVEAGASGYLLQDESIGEVVHKVRAAVDEEAIVSPTIAAAMMRRLRRLAQLETPLAFAEARATQLNDLTSREEEVLDLICDGCTNQEIADRLVIEYGTVKNHVHNILKKLEVNNRHEAASIYEIRRDPSLMEGAFAD